MLHAKKRAAPYLKQLMPTWLLCMFDSAKDVSKCSYDAFQVRVLLRNACFSFASIALVQTFVPLSVCLSFNIIFEKETMFTWVDAKKNFDLFSVPSFLI